MSIRVRNIISGNRKKIYRLLLLIVLAVTIFSVVIVFGSSRAPAERVSMHTVLGDAVAIFYNDSATVTSKRLVLEEAVAVGAELKGKEGFPLDSLESLERYLGHLSYREGKWDEAVQHYQKARRWNQHLKKGSDEKIMQEADYLFFMASLYYKSGLLDKSEKYYCEEVECLSLLDNHHIYLSDIYNNLGLIYIDREDYNVAVLYFMHALQIMEINFFTKPAYYQ